MGLGAAFLTAASRMHAQTPRGSLLRIVGASVDGTRDNLVQLHSLSGSVGLMVGLSLTDRNVKRILDHVRRMAQRAESYALLRRAEPWRIEATDLDAILEQMKARIRDGWEPGYDGTVIASLDKPGVRKRILSMIRALHALAWRREESTLSWEFIRSGTSITKNGTGDPTRRGGLKNQSRWRPESNAYTFGTPAQPE